MARDSVILYLQLTLCEAYHQANSLLWIKWIDYTKRRQMFSQNFDSLHNHHHHRNSLRESHHRKMIATRLSLGNEKLKTNEKENISKLLKKFLPPCRSNTFKVFAPASWL